MPSKLARRIISSFTSKREKHAAKSSQSHDMLLVRKARNRRVPTIHQVLRIGKILRGGEKIVYFLALTLGVVSFVWSFGVLSDRYRIEVPAVRGTYVEGIIGSVSLINPLFAPLNEADQDVSRLIYSGLMRYDSKRNLIGDLATTYTVSEDKKEYRFELRKGVTWHDGKPFTSQDVVFTFERMQNSRVGSPLSVTFQGAQVRAIDEYTVVFTLSEPFPAFLQSLTVGIIPAHVWGTVPQDTMRLAQRNLQPIGTGPFQFVKLEKDSSGIIHRLELSRFENYYKTPPFIKNFVFRFFNDYEGPQGVITALREQEIDGISFVPFEYREKVRRKQTVLNTLYLPQYTALFFNLKHTVLSDENTRVALRQSLDTSRIVSDILKHEGKAITSPILEGFPGYNSTSEPYEFSVEKANELLDKQYERITATEYRALLREKMIAERIPVQPVVEPDISLENEVSEQVDEVKTVTSTEIVAGERQRIEEEVDRELDLLFDDAQVFYRYKKADTNKTNILTIQLATVATPEYSKVAEVVAGYWQDIGVKVSVTLVDVQDLIQNVLRTRDYDVLLYGVIMGSDPDQYPFWHSSQASYPGLNLSGYEKRTVDEILTKIRTNDGEELLGQLYVEFQEQLNKDVPAIFLYTPTYTYVLSSSVNGFSIQHIALPSDRFSNITQWYLGTKKVWKWK